MKLDEITNKLASIGETAKEIEEKYGKRIEEINQKMEELNNLKGKSKQYIEDQQKKLEAQLQEIIDAQTKRVQTYVDKVTKDLTAKITMLGVETAQNLLTRLGVPVSTLEPIIAAAKKAYKEAIKQIK
jgi:F0F1-type ATP synthase membrane subunit b/b'